MFKRPAYISISVGFLSIYCAIMVFAALRVVFTWGDSSGPAVAVTAPPAVPAAPVVVDPSAHEPITPKDAVPFIILAYTIITFVCSVNMLEGANWARWLYTVMWLLFLMLEIDVHWGHMLSASLGIILYGYVVPFLFLPGANEFFRRQD